MVSTLELAITRLQTCSNPAILLLSDVSGQVLPHTCHFMPVVPGRIIWVMLLVSWKGSLWSGRMMRDEYLPVLVSNLVSK